MTSTNRFESRVEDKRIKRKISIVMAILKQILNKIFLDDTMVSSFNSFNNNIIE